MEWKRQPESDLHYCQEPSATYVQTWDGVQVIAGGKSVFVPMREASEENLRLKAQSLCFYPRLPIDNFATI